MSNPIVIVEPWCAQGTAGTDYVVPPQSSPDPTVVTQDFGLPTSQSQGLQSGGTLTERYDWNGALYLYSSILASLQQGAGYTADASVITAISGYTKGSILQQYLTVGSSIIPQLQVSLVDNNTNNFVITPALANDRTNWMQITNPVQGKFNKNTYLDTNNLYTISIINGYSNVYNNGTSIVYTLPAYNTLPPGFTVCIANQTGSITDGTNAITMTSGSSNAYYECEVGETGWIVDGQPIATYSQWATQAYVANNGYNELTFFASTTWTCPANVTHIWAWLVGGGGGGGGGYDHAGGGGGGMGGIAVPRLTVVPGTVYTITCGSGGAGGNGNTGGTGGTTSFGALVSVNGGGGGSRGANINGGVGGGGGSFGGNAGGSSNYSNSDSVGGTGGAGGWISIGGNGGIPETNGVAGIYGGGGGGGGGTTASTTGGNGGNGAIAIRW